MSILAALELDKSTLQSLVKSDDRDGLCEYIQSLVLRSGFERTGDTEWAYRRVATFLEDGWEPTLKYAKLQGQEFTAEEIGVVINRLISGYRFDQEHAEEIGAPWLFADGWPDRGDCAAYVFFTTTQAP